MQKNLSPWLQILAALKPFWWVRTFAGGMIVAAQALFAWNLWMTARRGGRYDYRTDLAELAGEGA
jgi:hypothetical protein